MVRRCTCCRWTSVTKVRSDGWTAHRPDHTCTWTGWTGTAGAVIIIWIAGTAGWATWAGAAGWTTWAGAWTAGWTGAVVFRSFFICLLLSSSFFCRFLLGCFLCSLLACCFFCCLTFLFNNLLKQAVLSINLFLCRRNIRVDRINIGTDSNQFFFLLCNDLLKRFLLYFILFLLSFLKLLLLFELSFVCCNLISDILETHKKIVVILIDLGNILLIVQHCLQIARTKQHLEIIIVSGFIHGLDTCLQCCILCLLIFLGLCQVVLRNADLRLCLLKLCGYFL